MPSKALEHWRTGSQSELDEFARAHTAVGGEGRGRRYFTRQLNHAYLVAVAAQFQRFCRDLHTEAALRIAASVTQADIGKALARLLVENRKLDTGNAHDGSLGPDFDRLGLSFLAEVSAIDSGNAARRRKLVQLNVWRNAIVHQNFVLKGHHEALVKGTNPDHITHVRMWSRNCAELAEMFDRVVRAYVSHVVAGPPWE
jgi:hypothetical protein